MPPCYPATTHCDSVARRVGDEQVRFAVRLMNLMQRCVQVGAMGPMTRQLLPSRWKGESATLWWENGHQTSECKG